MLWLSSASQSTLLGRVGASAERLQRTSHSAVIAAGAPYPKDGGGSSVPSRSMLDMLAIHPVEGRLTPPWWRSVLVVVVALFGTMTSLAFSPPSQRIGPGGTDTEDMVLVVIGFIAAIIASLALIWRHRHPLWWVVLASLLSLALPLGNTLPYIALAALIGRRRGSAVWAAAALVAATSTWVVISDARAQPLAASFLKTMFAPTGADPAVNADMGSATVVLMAALGWGTAVGVGLLLRGRREAVAARKSAAEDRLTTSALGDEVARRAERELIAREVHDVLGHRLSLLSLHAGALETHALEDPRLRSSAALVRDSASGAMQDLQSLLGVLRDDGVEQPDLPLTELPQVVEDSFGAGQLLTSSIFISNAEQASPTLSRAVYRIVQELVTNARKHAPGVRTTLRVQGGPGQAIVIDVTNPIIPAPHSTTSAGRGLTGVAERAELLGGRVTHGRDGTNFRVVVELPWQGIDAEE